MLPLRILFLVGLLACMRPFVWFTFIPVVDCPEFLGEFSTGLTQNENCDGLSISTISLAAGPEIIC